jgi:ribosome-associated protein
MHGKDENGEYRGPSKSMRKREASAAQDLGTRLIALRESELLTALNLPETLQDAILLAKRITSRGGLARQRQYIGKLMRDLDPAPIEAALTAR